MDAKNSTSIQTLLLITGVTALFFSPSAAAKQLGADPFSTNWVLDREQYHCILSQTVPQFGRVLFGRSPENPLSFEVAAERPLQRGESNKLKATPPPWRADMSGFMISKANQIGANARQVLFKQEDSQKAYKALRDGYSLQLSLLYGSPPEAIEVSIGGMGFSTLLTSFQACQEESKQLLIAENARIELEKNAADELARSMAKLNANSPKVAALTDGKPITTRVIPLQQKIDNLYDFYRIPFDRGDTELSSESSTRLDQLLRRWELGGMPESVELHGHADDAESTGSYINSDMRAQSVARYLMLKMPELQLKIEAHGDTLPLENVSSQRVDIMPSDMPSWE